MQKLLQLLKNKKSNILGIFLILILVSFIPMAIILSSCEDVPENLRTGNYYDKKIPYRSQDSIPFYSSPVKFTRFISPMGDNIEMQEVEFSGHMYIITNFPNSREAISVIHSPNCEYDE